MAPRRALYDAIIRHRHDLQRYSKREAAVILDLMGREDARLVTMLRSRLSRMVPTAGGTPGLGELLGSVRTMRLESLVKVERALRGDLLALAKVEGAAIERMATAAVRAPVTFNPIREAQLKAMLDRPVFGGIRGLAQEGKLFELSPEFLRGRDVVSLPAGFDPARVESVARARAAGKNLGPAKLAVRSDGSLEVIDGRHRIIDAVRRGSPVRATIARSNAVVGAADPTRSIFAQAGMSPVPRVPFKQGFESQLFDGGRGAGRSLSQWFGDLAEADQRRLSGAVQLGIQRQEHIDAQVKRIAGTRANGYQDGLLAISRREAESAVRTGVVHVANAAQHEWAKANDDVVTGLQRVEMMDERTCEECEAENGKFISLNDGPAPDGMELSSSDGLLHPNCRMTTVPYFDLDALADKLPDQQEAA